MAVPPLNLNTAKYLIPIDGKTQALGRKFVSTLNKSGAILPVILLESTVTGGRTYHAHKRDGYLEARERFTEEFLAAIFWLFGATMAGKVFDKIGQKFFKVPQNMPDVGRDIVRTPFDNYISKISHILKLSPEKTKAVKNSLAAYSVGKTTASIVTACLFIGLVVPKLNQAITRHMFGKKKKTTETPTVEQTANTNDKTKLSITTAKDISINAVENFKARLNEPDKANKNPSFKGVADMMLRIIQNFEENAIWKLMGTDVGTVSGRTANARNKDERVEILFRDISSIYFYCFSMPAIIKFMNRQDVFKGRNTRLDPVSAAKVHNKLVEAMANKQTQEMTPRAFKDFALGKNNYDRTLQRSLFPLREKPQPKTYLFGLIKKEPKLPIRTISLTDFNKAVDIRYANNVSEANRLKELALKMSSMQPAKDGAKILTETQVHDVLQGGILRQPEFLKEVINGILKTKEDLKPLENPYRYISIDSVEKYRKDILNYGKAIFKEAQMRNGNVTWDSMLKLNKRNVRKNSIFMALAMGVSSLFLSTIIPKLQYFITYKRTGKNSFPGAENLDK